MKKRLFFVLIFFLAIGTAQGQGVFEQLKSKAWQGTGTLMGQEANFSMQWESILDGQFIQLTFQNERIVNDSKVTFHARGMYKIQENKVKGTWFDSRGIQFPLKGTVSDTELTIEWGTPDTEEGKTVYAVKGAQIVVTDFILRNGEYYQFGSAVYK